MKPRSEHHMILACVLRCFPSSADAFLGMWPVFSGSFGYKPKPELMRGLEIDHAVGIIVRACSLTSCRALSDSGRMHACSCDAL